MSISSIDLRKEEEAVYRLRDLYQKHGYSQFKMSKFEEYDLYVRNKDFLISDSIITFTDTNGKLLALKPDVTLSIVKHAAVGEGGVEKVYYDENVYRVSSGTHSFREIMQVGIECIGDVDSYCLSEVLILAAKSLRLLSPDSVLDLSDFGLVFDLVNGLEATSDQKKEILKTIGEKNPHDTMRICRKVGVSEEDGAILAELAGLYGEAKLVLPRVHSLLEKKGLSSSLALLEGVLDSLSRAGFSDMVRIDFSVVNHIDYYNGIVFKGFVNGIPSAVLSGGQYDRLMKKMGSASKAVGFAVYLDLLEDMFFEKKNFDLDAVLLYSKDVSSESVERAVQDFVLQNKSVTAQKQIPKRIRYRSLYRVTESGVELLETNA